MKQDDMPLAPPGSALEAIYCFTHVYDDENDICQLHDSSDCDGCHDVVWRYLSKQVDRDKLDGKY